MRTVTKVLAGAMTAALMSTTAAVAADKIKIGIITTLAKGPVVLGKEQMNGFNLALKHLDNKIGGLPVELHVEDDSVNPAVGKQAADKLVKQHDVDVVTGVIWSHVLLATQKTVLGRRQDPHQRQCRPFQDGRPLVPQEFLQHLLAERHRADGAW